MAKPREFPNPREAEAAVRDLREAYHRAGVQKIRAGKITLVMVGSSCWLLEDGTVGPAEGQPTWTH